MVSKGLFLVAVRNDGKEISGVVQSVRNLPKGTLVVVMSIQSGIETFASVYLENTRWYRACTMTTPPITVASCDNDIPAMVG